MFLKVCLTTLCGVFLAQNSLAAELLPGFAPGKYELVSGDKILCENFSLDKKDLEQTVINIGGRYPMRNQRSKSVLDSDINPRVCEFRQTTDRSTSVNETTLVRINGEYCQNERKFESESRVRFRADRIHLEHITFEKGHEETYTCEWTRRPLNEKDRK